MSIAQKIASGFNTNGILVGANEYAYTKKRNLIRNGDMAIAQYDDGTVTGITTSGLYTCDGWNWRTNGDETISMLQNGNADLRLVSEFHECLRFDVTTVDSSLAANVYMRIRQSMVAREVGYRIKYGQAGAKPLTLSFWIKATKTGTNIAELFNVDSTRYCSQAYTISATDTWEFKTVTFPGDTGGSVAPNDAGDHLQVSFWVGAGSDFSGGTLGTTWHTTAANRAVGQVNHADSTDNDFSISGVQLELGTVATPFEFLQRGDNLHECKLFYQKSYKYSNSAGAVTQDGAIYTDRIPDSETHIGLQHKFSPQMVITPTLTLYSLNGTAGNVSDCAANHTHASDKAVSSVDVTGTGFNQVLVSSAFDDIAACHFKADTGF